eukprot:COSAG02_NODE_36672_length_452_cov_0.586402_1_plen_24_part_01
MEQLVFTSTGQANRKGSRPAPQGR